MSFSEQRNPPEIRGLFGPKGDSLNWLDAVSRFPNGVPRFDSKQEALDFMIEYNTYNSGSNPDFPQLQHIFTMLVGWPQIESILIPAMTAARQEKSFSKKVPRSYANQQHETADGDDDDDKKEEGAALSDTKTKNVYETHEARAVQQAIAQRLDVPFHKCTTPESTLNTLKYLFFHMKCGIYVMIRNGQLRIFAPFVNPDYRNTWSNELTLEGDGSLSSYYTQKAGLYREEQIEPDKCKWWANGNIICNELTKESDMSKMQHWGDHFLSPLRDMLGEVCRERHVPDCEFFLNKRDYPQLKVNVSSGIDAGYPVEPYGFIFDKDDRDPHQDVPLAGEHKYATYAPIVSFYAAAPDRFTDIPFPSSEDWEGACGLVFAHTFMHTRSEDDGTITMNGNPRDLFTEANFRKFDRGWHENRVATAFFRGTATGGGTTTENNQRLKVTSLCHEWKDDPVKGGEEPYLDAQIVGWNLRDKKTADGPMSFLRPKNFPFTAGKHHFTPIYEQSKYKYLVYVDGHCAACRYGFMMRLGSVILKVEPRQVADRMWYFDLLKPYHDHIPVKADLSDLGEKIAWCRANDEKCRIIGENAKAFYEKYVARSALLDYVEMVCKHIAVRQMDPPAWWNPPPAETEPPKLNKPEEPCYVDRKNSNNSRLCTRCQEDYTAELKEAEEAKKQNVTKKLSAAERKRKLQERKIRKAREAREAAEQRKKAKTSN